MITRIVRMEFLPDKLNEFQKIFNQSKIHIRNFPGCHHLELHRDSKNSNVRYTYSIWEDEKALDAYRESELFQQVWPQTKILFAEKPKAYSLIRMEEV